MQQMKNSVAKSLKSSKHRRHRKREKDSFVGAGGLGSELKGLEYKNVPVQDDYDEV